MRRLEHPDGIAAGLAALSHRDRARILREAQTRSMRGEEIVRLVRAAGQGLARAGG